tara:strand:- start:3551 stop:3727 length:177 start_codon:yes stop_codon:yes gene_type:complete
MRVITLQELEFDLEDIITAINIDKDHLKIKEENVILIPFEDYKILKDSYHEWLNNSHN